MRTFFPLLTLALMACPAAERDYADPPLATGARLSRFESCDELRDSLTASFVEELVSSRYGMWAYPEAAGGEDASNGDGASDYSTTNVQEAGVDEPDLVKTDGSYLYVVTEGLPEVLVVDAWPAEETAVVGRLELDGWPYSMLLDGDTLAVFQYLYDYRDGMVDGDVTPLRDGYGTRVTLVDVGDRTQPEVIRHIDLEGWVASARLIDHDMWIVLNDYLYVDEAIWNLAWDESLGLPEYDYEATDEEQEATRALARELLWPHVEAEVAAMDLEELLPNWYAGEGGAWTDGEALVSCTDVYHPEGVAQPGLLTVTHLDLSAPQTTEPASTGLLANGWSVYASLDALYVAQTSYWWSWGWTEGDLSTHLHRFELGGSEPAYVASGAVDGWLWSQFAMDEEGDTFRVATTEWDWWWGTGGEAGNNVYVLDAASMDTLGAVTGIAPDESIYAVRFLGDLAWMVTFRQTDPLFAIDLADPTAPTVVGELEIPGFSSYIHPIEDGWLLTVGMAGEDDGDLTGFALKLFDVRDPTNPLLADEAVIESDDWSWSESMWDHHAFTLHNGVLAVPVYTYDYDDVTGDWTGFSGLWVNSVDTTAGIDELGRVDHADLVSQSDCIWDEYYGVSAEDGGTDVDSGEACDDDAYWYAGLRRSVVMEDWLYSVSDYGVKVTALRDPSDIVATARFWPLE